MCNAKRQSDLRSRRKAARDKLDAKAAVNGWKRVNVLVYVGESENPFSREQPELREFKLFTLDGKPIAVVDSAVKA